MGNQKETLELIKRFTMRNKKNIQYLEVGARIAGVMATREQIEYMHAFMERMIETGGVFNFNEYIDAGYSEPDYKLLKELNNL